MGETTNVVIPDPGLREFGGHHPATIKSLATLLNSVKNIRTTVYSSKYIDSDCLNNLKQTSIKIEPFFETNFYESFYDNINYSKKQHYIRQLALEYISLFKSVKDNNELGNTVFLFHTLNWEHACSLDYALKVFPLYLRPKCVVFLMYKAKSKNTDRKKFAQQELSYYLGFKELSKQSCVDFYATDFEVASFYSRLLNKQIPLHPCFLLSKQYLQESKNEGRGDAIILFLGDAKDNKGFYEIDSLAEQLLSGPNFSNRKLIIQYTLTNDVPELLHQEEILKRLANVNKNVLLINEFIEEEKLHKLLLESSTILFNYDSNVYAEQSSGVLYIASIYKLKIVTLTETWINREAARLGILCLTATFENLVHTIEQIESMASLNTTEYHEIFFQNFGNWLQSKVITLN